MKSGVTVIRSKAFCGFASLTELSMPNSITSVDSYAFSGCVNLQELSLPSGLLTIGEGAFKDCGKDYAAFPNKIDFPQNLTTLGANAFENVKLIYLKTWANNIGANAFSGNSLRYVSLHSSEAITLGGSNLPFGAGLTALYLKSPLVSAQSYSRTLYFENSTVSCLNGKIQSAGVYSNYLHTWGSDKWQIGTATEGNYVYGYSGTYTSVNAPRYVFNIDDPKEPTAVSGIECTNYYTNHTVITSLHIPKYVNRILKVPTSLTNISADFGYSYFDGGNRYMRYPIEYISNNAFYGCSNLVIDDSNKQIFNSVINVGDSAFYGCSKMTKIDFGTFHSESGKCFGSLNNIGSAAFPSSLQSIFFGKVENISSMNVSPTAFVNTTANLKVFIPSVTGQDFYTSYKAVLDGKGFGNDTKMYCGDTLLARYNAHIGEWQRYHKVTLEGNHDNLVGNKILSLKYVEPNQYDVLNNAQYNAYLWIVGQPEPKMKGGPFDTILVVEEVENNIKYYLKWERGGEPITNTYQTQCGVYKIEYYFLYGTPIQIDDKPSFWGKKKITVNSEERVFGKNETYSLTVDKDYVISPA